MSGENKFDTEETIIPAEVQEVMAKYDTENKGVDDNEDVAISNGDKQDDSEDKGDSSEADGEDKSTDNKEADSESGGSVGDEEASGDTDDTEPIPQEQVNIARRLGWSDDYIVEVASNNPEILEDMVALAGRQTQQPQVQQKEEPAPKKTQEVKEVGKVELDGEALKKMKDNYGDEVVDAVIKPLADGLNKTIDELNALRGNVSGVEQTNKQNQAIKDFEEANAVFDKLSETFEVFGKTETLPKLADGSFDMKSPAVKARADLFRVAHIFRSGGDSWQDSLKNAVRWYKGENAEKSLERKIVKKINSRRKKFSPRPTSKRTKQKVGSREEEGVKLVEDAYKTK